MQIYFLLSNGFLDESTLTAIVKDLLVFEYFSAVLLGMVNSHNFGLFFQISDLTGFCGK